MIDSFKGEYRFLSNFWECEIIYEDISYPSVEHAYQAAKAVDSQVKKKIATASTPGKAKREGQKAIKVLDWDNKKFSIMKTLVTYKFTTHEDLKQKLLETGEQQLIEGNTWKDVYWGVCDGIGDNNLGKILMEIRDNLKNGK